MWKFQLILGFEVADVGGTVEQQWRVGVVRGGLRGSHIEFVFQFAYQLLQHIFHADYACGRAEFVDHYGQVALALLKFAEQGEQGLGFGDDEDLVHDLSNFHLRDAFGGRRGDDAETETEARPTHQIFGVEYADDVFGTALRIIHRDARTLLVDYAREGFVEIEVGGKRKNSGAWDHHLPRRDVIELKRIQQHLFLRGRKLSGGVSGGDDQLEFVGRVDGPVADVAGSEGAENEPGGAAHADGERSGEGEKDVHGRGDREGDSLGALQRQRLRNEFPEDHVQASDTDKRHGHGDGMSVDGGIGHATDPTLEQSRQDRFAEPAQSQTGNGDSQLHAVDDAAELLMKFEDGACAGAASFDQLLDASFADADERELGCGEESIGRHQEQDDEHPQQHVCNHGTLILTFQRDKSSAFGEFTIQSRVDPWHSPGMHSCSPGFRKLRASALAIPRMKPLFFDGPVG